MVRNGLLAKLTLVVRFLINDTLVLHREQVYYKEEGRWDSSVDSRVKFNSWKLT